MSLSIDSMSLNDIRDRRNDAREKSHIVLLIFVLFAIATAYNIYKPYHIDDAEYLEMAQWVSINPLKPMSGLVNWGLSPEPIYKLHQPPLYFYLLGTHMRIFGENEVSTHLFQSVFTFLAILFFFKLAKLHSSKHAGLLTMFFVFCPAFIVEQNLMIDIPLVSLWIIFYYILSLKNVKSKFIVYLTASLIASIAILTKYTSLTLIPALIIGIILRRDYKYLYMVVVPLLIIMFWSMFNYVEYGSIHILDRPIREITFWNIIVYLLSWIVCLGGIATFTVPFISGLKKDNKISNRMINKILGIALLSVAFVMVLFYSDLLTEFYADFFLRILFFACGSIMVGAMVNITIRELSMAELSQRYQDHLLLVWFYSGMFFIILFSPLIAPRHVLPIIPAMIILLGKHYLPKAKKQYKIAGVVISISLSLMLGISDWSFANFYKQQARSITEDYGGEANLWFSGHWGWQWYARLNGMKQIDSEDISFMKEGDYIIYPDDIVQQALDNRVSVEIIEKREEKRKIYDYFSTHGGARFYWANAWKIPWNLSKKSLGPIIIFKIKEIKE